MAVRLRRGFKGEANGLARALRAELGLGPADPLDPWLLADHLSIPITPLSDLVSVGIERLGLIEKSQVRVDGTVPTLDFGDHGHVAKLLFAQASAPAAWSAHHLIRLDRVNCFINDRMTKYAAQKSADRIRFQSNLLQHIIHEAKDHPEDRPVCPASRPSPQ